MSATEAMKIRDFLSAADVALDVRASDKASLLGELAARAASALNLSADAIATEIEKRDELGSTGIGGGVSIPHARFRRRPASLIAVHDRNRDVSPAGLDGTLLLCCGRQLNGPYIGNSLQLTLIRQQR